MNRCKYGYKFDNCIVSQCRKEEGHNDQHEAPVPYEFDGSVPKDSFVLWHTLDQKTVIVLDNTYSEFLGELENIKRAAYSIPF